MTDLRPDGQTTVMDIHQLAHAADQAAARRASHLTLTVPTRELLILLTDTIPFASPEQDETDQYCIQLSWDVETERLNAISLDGFRTAWSSWGPDDTPEPGSGDDQLGVDYGPHDDYDASAAITITPDDAKDIVGTFKVGKKDGRTPLRLELNQDRCKITRSADTGYSEHTMVLRGTQSRFPDVRAMLTQTAHAGDGHTLPGAAFTPAFLADFCTKVRRGSVLEMTFPNSGMALIRVGRHFRGSIMLSPPETS